MKGDHGIRSEGWAGGTLRTCWPATACHPCHPGSAAFLSNPLWSPALRLGKAGRAGSETSLGLQPAEEQLPAGVPVMAGADPGSSTRRQHLGTSAHSARAPGSADSLGQKMCPSALGKTPGLRPQSGAAAVPRAAARASSSRAGREARGRAWREPGGCRGLSGPAPQHGKLRCFPRAG